MPPRHVRKPSSAAEALDPGADPAAPPLPVVLVVEDDDHLRRLLARALRRDGYEVVELDDGADCARYLGCAILESQKVPLPDLVVTDLRMPGFTGLEVLSAVRWIDPHLPVLMITAFGDDVTRERARGLGVTAVIDKPVDLDDLRAEVRRHLGG